MWEEDVRIPPNRKVDQFSLSDSEQYCSKPSGFVETGNQLTQSHDHARLRSNKCMSP